MTPTPPPRSVVSWCPICDAYLQPSQLADDLPARHYVGPVAVHHVYTVLRVVEGDAITRLLFVQGVRQAEYRDRIAHARQPLIVGA